MGLEKRWFQSAGLALGGYWDLALGYWQRQRRAPGQHDEHHRDRPDAGLPLAAERPHGPYVEAGHRRPSAVAHARSATSALSTAFQFGDHLGVGYRFGAKGAFDLGYRFQHLSNAGIKRPNHGINFHQIRLQYHF